MNNASPNSFERKDGLSDLHKHNVETFFSGTSFYWGAVYLHPRDARLSMDEMQMRQRMDTVLRVVDEYAAGRSLSVLDAGCGPGVILEELARRGHRLAAIDLSESMVRQANERVKPYVGGAEVCRLGDVEALPFSSESMDMVLCLGVLPYLPEDGRALAEISRVLKPGGLGVLVLTNLLKLGNLFDPYYYVYRSWQYVWYHLLKRRRTARQAMDAQTFGCNKAFGIRRYTYRHVQRLLSPSGWSRVSVQGIVYGPLTFWGREFLPASFSRRMNRGLEQLAARRGGRWLQALASQWVIAFVKR